MNSYRQHVFRSGAQDFSAYSQAPRGRSSSRSKFHTYQRLQGKIRVTAVPIKKNVPDLSLSYQTYFADQTAASKTRTIRSRLSDKTRSFLASLISSNEEIDRIADEPLRSYAKRALICGGEVVPLLPRISKSPGEGVALQTSTRNGTINLIIEGEQAILIRVGDDVVLQMTCSLSHSGFAEMLDTYSIELERLIEG